MSCRPSAATAAAAHAAILAQCGRAGLTFTSSRCSDTASRHVVSRSASLRQLRAFLHACKTVGLEKRALVGSLDESIILSCNLKFQEPPRAKKRRWDGDADVAAKRVRRSGDESEAGLSSAAYETAARSASRLSLIRGCCEEQVVDSYAISLRRPREFGNSSEKDALVVGARLAPGSAFQLSKLLDAAGTAVDGMLSVDAPPEGTFALPPSEATETAAKLGQSSLYVFLSVPED